MGLTMYDSLVQTSSEPFVLHYLCIDDQTYDKIVEIADPNLVAWRVSDLEMPAEALELQEVRGVRLRGEVALGALLGCTLPLGRGDSVGS